MKNIEVEIRSVISAGQYQDLLNRFLKEGKLLADDTQETWYFAGTHDLRIQRNNVDSHIKLKKGKLFDEHREELQIGLPRTDFGKAADFFGSLGYEVSIKWLRRRHTFSWQGIEVMLDDTKGYGYVIELERLCSSAEKDEALRVLQEKMRGLGITPTPRDEMERRHEEYKNNWPRLLKDNLQK